MIGIDALDRKRARRAFDRAPESLLKRLFSEAERSRGKNWEDYATAFCVKEAVIKVLGRRVPWTDMEIRRRDRHRLTVLLEGRAEVYARRLGIAEVLVSKTDTPQLIVVVAMGSDETREDSCSCSAEEGEVGGYHASYSRRAKTH